MQILGLGGLGDLGTAELLFLLLILSMAVIVSVPQNFVNSITSHVHLLTLIVFSISAIVTLINFKHGLKQQSTECYKSKLDKLQNINKLFMDNEDLGSLYAELYSIPSRVSGVSGMNERTPQKEYLISNIIFITMSEIYMCDDDDLESCNEFASIFKTWMKSPTLKRQWLNQKHYFDKDVVAFIDSLVGGQLGGERPP